MVYNIRERSRRVINAALSNILISMRAKCEGTYGHTLSPPTGGAAHAHIGICVREHVRRISSHLCKTSNHFSVKVAGNIASNVPKILDSVAILVDR